MRLTAQTLSSVPSTIGKPNYDPSVVQIGSVNFGTGGFFLGHQALNTHQLMQQGNVEAFQWGIATVNLGLGNNKDASRARIQQLNDQDGLYTIVEKPGDDVTIVGSVRKAFYAPDNNQQAIIDLMAQPGTKMVTMTMTEGGYYMDTEGKLRLEHADIQHDLQQGTLPKTALGYIAHAYKKRLKNGAGGFTVLSCDNLQNSGEFTREAVIQFIQAWDSSLVAAAERDLDFPSAMVDRIVPGGNPELADIVSTATGGVSDSAPIAAEKMPMIAWVLENNFRYGRPAWEELGPHVRVVPDVAPYEKMKLRLLNASHLFVSCLGDLAGYETIWDVMSHPMFKKSMRNLMDNETGPTVPVSELANVDLAAYKKELVTRFANTAVPDTTQRVATDAPLRVVLDTIRELKADGKPYPLLALTVAAWLKRTRGGVNEMRNPIVVADRQLMKDELARLGAEGAKTSDPRPQLSIEVLFGDLGKDQDFVTNVGHWLKKLDTKGVQSTMRDALGGGVSEEFSPRVKRGTAIANPNNF